MKINSHLINIYIFIESFNNLIEKKILKLKNIRIIYENTNIPSENFLKVIKFCKVNIICSIYSKDMDIMNWFLIIVEFHYKMGKNDRHLIVYQIKYTFYH